MRAALILLPLLCLILVGCPYCVAESYPVLTTYERGGKRLEDQGTAVCFACTDRQSLLLTAAHNLHANPHSVWVSDKTNWIRVSRVVSHPTADIAVLELPARLQVTPLGDAAPEGAECLVEGFGPRANASGDRFWFRGQITGSEHLRGVSGEHAIPGDSGGPVLCKSSAGACVVGIVTAHDGPTPARYRTQFAREKARTRFVPAETIVTFVRSQYGGCDVGICPVPVRVRPQIQQPMLGIGIPVGPPRIVDTIERVPPPPVITQRDYAGPVGPAGPPGPAGRDGRSITRTEVEAVVNAWLSANADQLRGPPGPAGHAADLTDLERRLSDVERRPFRMILTSDGQVIDDETYAPGEPVVLDLRRLRNSANADR